MPLIYAVILGIIQGLTEFLPISSSGHLVLAQEILGFETPPVLFDILVHVGTLTAIIYYFRVQLTRITTKYLRLILVGTIPAIIVGLLLNDYTESFFSSLLVVALGFITTGLILLSTKFISEYKPIKLNSKNSLIIGVFQALAIIPGISRSGSTITAGLHRHLKRDTAFEFSFILSIPAILGALVLQFFQLDSIQPVGLIPSIVGMITAAVTGIFALKILRKIIYRSQLYYLSFYCLTLGLAVLIYSVNTSS